MHVREWGPADGPMVLLLHALGCHGGWFDEVGPLLAAEGYRAVAPDLRGHGESPWQASYGFADYAADVEGLVGERPYALVGHSMGGYIGLMVAARGLRPPTKLFVADMKTSASPEELAGLKAASMRPLRTFASLEEAVDKYKLAPPDHAVRPERFLDVAASVFRLQADGTWADKFDRRAMALEPLDPLGLVARVRCPVRFVRGEHSAMMPPGPAAELARAAGAHLVEMPGLYHHLPLEAPEAFAQLVLEFLAE